MIISIIIKSLQNPVYLNNMIDIKKGTEIL